MNKKFLVAALLVLTGAAQVQASCPPKKFSSQSSQSPKAIFSQFIPAMNTKNILGTFAVAYKFSDKISDTVSTYTPTAVKNAAHCAVAYVADKTSTVTTPALTFYNKAALVAHNAVECIATKGLRAQSGADLKNTIAEIIIAADTNSFGKNSFDVKGKNVFKSNIIVLGLATAYAHAKDTTVNYTKTSRVVSVAQTAENLFFWAKPKLTKLVEDFNEARKNRNSSNFSNNQNQSSLTGSGLGASTLN